VCAQPLASPRGRGKGNRAAACNHSRCRGCNPKGLAASRASHGRASPIGFGRNLRCANGQRRCCFESLGREFRGNGFHGARKAFDDRPRCQPEHAAVGLVLLLLPGWFLFVCGPSRCPGALLPLTTNLWRIAPDYGFIPNCVRLGRSKGFPLSVVVALNVAVAVQRAGNIPARPAVRSAPKRGPR
jgi:hypothetical protein